MLPSCDFLRGVAVAALVTLTTGCGGPGGSATGDARDARTPQQYFKEQQVNTMTPNGKIMTDSVTEQEGKIRYQTEDGKQWRVGYAKRADGTYHYTTPEQVK